jgi:hypothetical protein
MNRKEKLNMRHTKRAVVHIARNSQNHHKKGSKASAGQQQQSSSYSIDNDLASSKGIKYSNNT